MLFASHLSRCPSLIDATGLFPAGLVLRMFILNSLIRFRAISVDTVVANGWARARARIIGRGHCHVYIVLGTIVVISFARYVRCPYPHSAFSDSDSAAASVPIVAAPLALSRSRRCLSDFATQIDASACHDLARKPNFGMAHGRYGNCHAGEGRARGSPFAICNCVFIDTLLKYRHTQRNLTHFCAEIQDTESMDFHEDAARVHRYGGKDTSATTWPRFPSRF